MPYSKKNSINVLVFPISLFEKKLKTDPLILINYIRIHCDHEFSIFFRLSIDSSKHIKISIISYHISTKDKTQTTTLYKKLCKFSKLDNNVNNVNHCANYMPYNNKFK